jgi:hypothetical protein
MFCWAACFILSSLNVEAIGGGVPAYFSGVT